AASLQYQPHEGEEGNGKQCLVRHLSEDAVRYGPEQIDRQQAHFDADETEGETDESQREGNRIAEQKHDHQRQEHKRGEIFRNKSNHVRPPQSAWASASSMATVSGMRP